MDRNEKLIKRLCDKGYKHITDDVFNLSKRIAKYDKNLELFFNPFNERYEIHTSLSMPSYCVGAEVLDSRILTKLKQADNRTEYGFREKIDSIEKDEMEKERNFNKKARELSQDTAKEIAKVFK